MSVPARFADYLFGYLSRWEASGSPTIVSSSPPSRSRRQSEAGSMIHPPAVRDLPASTISRGSGDSRLTTPSSSALIGSRYHGGSPPHASAHANYAEHPLHHQSIPRSIPPFGSPSGANLALNGVPAPLNVPPHGATHAHGGAAPTAAFQAGSIAGDSSVAANAPWNQQQPLPPPLMGEDVDASSLDEFWRNMTGGSWDNMSK